MKGLNVLKIVLLGAFSSAFVSCTPADQSIFGEWVLEVSESTDMATWRYRQLTLEIQQMQDRVEILQKWRRGKEPFYIDSLSVVPGGAETEIQIERQHWPDNWYMGVLAMKGSAKSITGNWKVQDRHLHLSVKQPVQTSQGDHLLTTEMNFQVDQKLDRLTVQVQRSTRPTPVELIFYRTKKAR